MHVSSAAGTVAKCERCNGVSSKRCTWAWVCRRHLTAGACCAGAVDGGEATLMGLGASLVGDLQLAGALDDVLDLDGLDIGRHAHATGFLQLPNMPGPQIRDTYIFSS